MTVSIPEKLRHVTNGPRLIGETDPIPFEYKEVTHVKVATKENVLVLNEDYEVQGKNVIYKVEISVGETIVIYRQTPVDNDAEFPQEAEFDSAKINDSIDKLTMIVQEQQDALSRAIQLPTYIAPEEGIDSITPVPEAGKSLKWDAEGKYLVNTIYELDEIGKMTESATKAANDAAVAAKNVVTKLENYEANTYTKAETNDLLADKQDAFVTGQHLSLSGGILSVALDTIMTGYTEDAWNALSAEEQAAIPLALIYE